MVVVHFKTVDELHRWFRKYGTQETEIWIGFYRKDLQLTGVSYAEALDEALCWGWIDGVRRKVDHKSYTNRFTPRKPKSNWSLVNLRHVDRLTQAGRMQPAGIAAFEARKPERTGVYSFERDESDFDASLLATFRRHQAAWKFFEQQPPGYRRITKHWIMSAKRSDTRERRLQLLIEACNQFVRMPQLVGKKKSSE
ncbi:MAG: YdeI/OmpD-associated family protein [Pirellula sp.]